MDAMVTPGRADAAGAGGQVPLDRVIRRLEGAGLVREVRGEVRPALSGVCQDSRVVQPGDLFLAWRGTEHDAHAFVPQAIRAGAVAVVAEEAPEGEDVPTVVVADGRWAAALAADEVLGSPGEELFLAAVTGTNGKTTTACLARHLLEGSPERAGAGGPAAALGTLGLVEGDGAVRPGSEGLTTPGPVTFSAWLRALADEGMGSLVVEASSHALEQRRLDGARFQAVAFTNLAHDHLDYHASREAYRDAKVRLAELLGPDGVAVVNGSEPAWRHVAVPAERTVRFHGPDAPTVEEEEATDEGGARLRARDLAVGPHGSSFRLERTGGGEPPGGADVRLPLLGRFNVENALAAAGLALAAGRSLEEVASALASMPQVPGRLEVVVREPATVVVDFAHSPEALAGVLDTLRPLFPGRLIAVFGAGGDRDPSKRGPMGKAVAERADIPVVTSDNPRREDPGVIADAIVEGMEGGELHRVLDRHQAIERALGLAEEGDCVLVAGKGHETYQEVDGERLPFDDREVVREVLGMAGGDGSAPEGDR